MNGPLVSIIIPIYKVEQYLLHCLDSVSKQTYKNIEVLLVNDGSPDLSGQIAKKYTENDSRFIYFEKTNGGLSSARNLGIDRCSGEYISFVDSDDWLEPTFIECLVEAAEKTNSDIAICNIKYIYSNGTERSNVPKIKAEKCVSNIEALSDLFNSKYFRNHAVNKLYKSSLFKNTDIRYPLGRLYEDVFTTYRLIYEARQVVYIPGTLYNYLQARPGSILNFGFNNKQLDILDGLDSIRGFIRKKGIYGRLRNDYIQLAISNILAIGNLIYPVYNTMSSQGKRELNIIIKSTRTRFGLEDYIKNNNLSLSQKIRYFMMLHALGVYSFGMKVIRK